MSWCRSEWWLKLVMVRGGAAGASGDMGEHGGRASSAAIVHGGGCGSAHTPRAAPGLGYTCKPRLALIDEYQRYANFDGSANTHRLFINAVLHGPIIRIGSYTR